MYRDGQLAYSCICVSGLPTEKNDRITRTGVWYIKEKKPEKVLVGEDYETPVKYWIRILSIPIIFKVFIIFLICLIRISWF